MWLPRHRAVTWYALPDYNNPIIIYYYYNLRININPSCPVDTRSYNNIDSTFELNKVNVPWWMYRFLWSSIPFFSMLYADLAYPSFYICVCSPTFFHYTAQIGKRLNFPQFCSFNWPLALRGHVTNAFLKQLVVILLLPKN